MTVIPEVARLNPWEREMSKSKVLMLWPLSESWRRYRASRPTNGTRTRDLLLAVRWRCRDRFRPPGPYVFKADSPSNRNIVQVFNQDQTKNFGSRGHPHSRDFGSPGRLKNRLASKCPVLSVPVRSHPCIGIPVSNLWSRGLYEITIMLDGALQSPERIGDSHARAGHPPCHRTNLSENLCGLPRAPSILLGRTHYRSECDRAEQRVGR